MAARILSVLAIAALNCVGFLFISGLAAVGGYPQGMYPIWHAGFAWIALMTLLSLALCFRGKHSAGLATAASTLPGGFPATLIGSVAFTVFGSLRPNTPEFDLACKDAGARYIASPLTPIQSIAYDWQPATEAPSINFFSVSERGNIANRRGGVPEFPPSIQFTESRCCRFEGRPLNKVGPYTRHPNNGAYFGVTELSADALVTFKTSQTDQQGGQPLQIVDIAVSDRRDGQLLATLRYVLDEERQRGCGVTSNGIMDETAFIAKAVGIH